ncbi:MAG: lysophospholipid acyltransferase family protein [Xanthomonadales bacterium]|jgi:KDO2-lipid IV(A) lauroyltransferase|nr:lysophospholipid acyltransferase family protein [Xanthomonadales bacterium]
MDSRPNFHPRHWPGWLSVAFIEVAARVSPLWAHRICRLIAPLLLKLLKKRRHIAEINIAHCFPERSPAWQQQLLRQHFYSVSLMLFESAWTWSSRPLSRQLCVEIHGAEHLEQHTDTPILLMSGHMSCMDLGSRFLGEYLRLNLGRSQKTAGVYRPLRSPVLEWYHTRGRLRFTDAMISKYKVKQLMRYLQSGAMVWYAADQDFGAERSLFVPFFGHQTATLKASWLLIRRSQATVLTMFPQRLSPGRYRIDIGPPIHWQEGMEISAFLGEVNQRIEAAVRQAPAQYWWLHRRFKTRPEGQAAWY